jgi:mono/diheme cytochrome c family protein
MRSTTRVSVGAVLLVTFVATSSAADLERGTKLYKLWCDGCHMPAPPQRMVPARGGGPLVASIPPAGTHILQERYQGKIPAALVERTDLTEASIVSAVRQGRPIMTALRKTEVSDRDLADIVA